MPLYEYECRACRRRTEVIQRYADLPLETCPECGGPVERLLSAPSFQFKGTGWYATDYAGKKTGATAESAGGNGKPESPSDAKSESKAATKTESKGTAAKKTAAADS